MEHDTDNKYHVMNQLNFYNTLKQKTHRMIMHVYDATELFPKNEQYASADQLRRAAVSVMLNFVEGHARFRPKVKRQFFETSYGSLQESKYLIYLAKERQWITAEQYDKIFTLLDEIGAMLWSIIEGIKKKHES